MSKRKTYRLVGFDTFEGAEYAIPGRYRTLQQAREAARARLLHLEQTQPSESSGGQGFFGIQDRVFIEHPDGTRERAQ